MNDRHKFSALALAVLLLVSLFGSGAQPARAASTGVIARFNSLTVVGNCNLGPGAWLPFSLTLVSSLVLDYTLSVDSGPAGLAGSFSGTLPAVTHPDFPTVGPLINIDMPAPWSFTVRLVTSAGGVWMSEATAEVSCAAAGFPYTVTPLSFTNTVRSPGEAAARSTAPGCDVLMPRGSDAVVGRLLRSVDALWYPDASLTTGTLLEGGKTFWVIGQDASHTYYQLLVQCRLVWVPADAVGPNPDEVWNNAPLPTRIVG